MDRLPTSRNPPLVVRRRPGTGLLIAQAIGRIGNYFNHELFGLPTTLPWGLEIESTNAKFPDGLPDGTLFHPLFLYEILWNLAGIAIILISSDEWPFDGVVRLRSTSSGTGLGRSWLEAIRIDPTSDGFWGYPRQRLGVVRRRRAWCGTVVIQAIRHREPETSIYRFLRETDSGASTSLPHRPVKDASVEEREAS